MKRVPTNSHELQVAKIKNYKHMKQFILNLAILLAVTIFFISCSDDNIVNPDDLTGGGSITINGGGFSNKTFDFTMGVAAYDTEYQATACNLFGENDGDSVVVALAIDGNSSGNYSWQDWGIGDTTTLTGALVVIEAGILSNFYFSESGLTIVTTYGAIAQNIKGTFSGKLIALFDVDSITVEGSFNCLRLEDDSAGDF